MCNNVLIQENGTMDIRIMRTYPCTSLRLHFDVMQGANNLKKYHDI